MRLLIFVTVVSLFSPNLASASKLQGIFRPSSYACLIDMVRTPTLQQQKMHNARVVEGNQPPGKDFSFAQRSTALRLEQVAHNLDHAVPNWRDKNWELAVMRDKQALYTVSKLEKYNWGEVAILSDGIAIGRINYHEDKPVQLF